MNLRIIGTLVFNFSKNHGIACFKIVIFKNELNLDQKIFLISMEGQLRSNVSVGIEVDIVQKHHQRSGELTTGFVKRILTKAAKHTHGIKVLLETGEVGRIKSIH